MPVGDWLELDRTDALLVDVRETEEFSRGHIPKAVNLPLSRLRSRYMELQKDRVIWLYCAVGQRAYFATRFLTQQGYRAVNLSGGYTTYKSLKAVGIAA
jgi:rhodanese-related sulfurtransferase